MHEFSNNAASLIQAIESLSPGGGTPMAAAMGVASQYMQQNGRGKTGEIILMCDGQNDCGSVQDATNAVRTSTIPTNVSTIGFDIPPGSQADQDLRSVASQTGGRNYSASNSKELIHARMKKELATNPREMLDPAGCRDLYFWAKSQDAKKVKDPVLKALLFDILISAQKGGLYQSAQLTAALSKLGSLKRIIGHSEVQFTIIFEWTLLTPSTDRPSFTARSTST